MDIFINVHPLVTLSTRKLTIADGSFEWIQSTLKPNQIISIFIYLHSCHFSSTSFCKSHQQFSIFGLTSIAIGSNFNPPPKKKWKSFWLKLNLKISTIMKPSFSPFTQSQTRVDIGVIKEFASHVISDFR